MNVRTGNIASKFQSGVTSFVNTGSIDESKVKVLEISPDLDLKVYRVPLEGEEYKRFEVK